MTLEIAIDSLRILCSALAIYNMSWSARGFICFVQGHDMGLHVYRSVIFLFGCIVASFGIGHFMHSLEADYSFWRLFNQMLIIFALGIAAWGHRLSVAENFERLHSLRDVADAAEVIKALHEIDPVQAAAVVQLAKSAVEKHNAD
jgi:hypothetical protein